MRRAPTKDVADVLFRRCGEVAMENHRANKAIAAVRRVAQKGLRTSAEEGAVVWRDALEKIVELTK